jgi:hypothetical protein
MPHGIAWVLAAGIIIAPAVEAQVCAGTPAFSAGRVRVGAGTAFGDTAKHYGVQLAGGATQGPFGSATVSTVHYHQVSQYDHVSGSGTAVATSVGSSLNQGGSAQFCPLLGFRYQKANTDTRLGPGSSSAAAFSLGGSLGGIVKSEPGTDYILFTSAALVLSHGSERFGDFSGSSNEHWIEITAGVGVIMSRVLTLQPAVNLWSGGLGGGSSLSIAVAVNFGGASQR